MTDLSRRRFLGISAVLLGSGFNLDCIGVSEQEQGAETNDGRLAARPGRQSSVIGFGALLLLRDTNAVEVEAAAKQDGTHPEEPATREVCHKEWGTTLNLRNRILIVS